MFRMPQKRKTEKETETEGVMAMVCVLKSNEETFPVSILTYSLWQGSHQDSDWGWDLVGGGGKH